MTDLMDSPLLAPKKQNISPPKPARPTKARLMAGKKAAEGDAVGREGARSSESMHFSDLESTRYSFFLEVKLFYGFSCPSAGWSVGCRRLVRLSLITSKKGGKFHVHAPFRALLFLI